ncbi:MAG: VOC family protein [Acidimicrobiales bacterium]
MPVEPTGHTAAGGIVGFDHVALPMQDAPAMLAFYRSLGLEVAETPYLLQVYVGNQMVNFHRLEFWRGEVDLRAPAAVPPCGDLCLVWEGSADALQALLDRVGALVIEGPAERQGGRRTTGSSVCVRDPDGNLLEFIRYAEGGPTDRAGAG